MIDLRQYIGKEIMGTYDLIYFLIEKQNIKFDVIKDRLFYKTSELRPVPIIHNTHLALLDELNQLIELFQNYYEEEYNGKRNKTIDQLEANIKQQISENEIYVLRAENKIVSFCSINNPDIGIMFTKNGFRGNGYAKQLLFQASQELLKHNTEIYIMTDLNNIPSNEICEALGYKQFYKHTNLILI